MNQPTYNSETKIWSGPKSETIYNSEVSLGYLILNVLKQTPERVTQVSADTNVELTCHEMRKRTMKIVNYLQTSGYKQGDIVGIMASNSENLAPVVFACLSLGLPINPLAPVMTECDVIQMYSKTKPKIIFCDANIVETLKNAVKKMKTKCEIYTLMAKVDGFKFVDDLLAVDYDENCFV
jgi:4-coumarate--CoA ligase